MYKNIANKQYNVAVVFEDSFESLDNWISESNGAIELEKSTLTWDCFGKKGDRLGQGTLWCKQYFEGPTITECHVVSLEGADNINFFYYAEEKTKGLLKTSDMRDGSYKQYHDLQNYIVTYLLSDLPQWRIRFRKCPGFNLISESYVDLPKEKGIRHKVTTIIEKSGLISFYRDDVLLHSYQDSSPYLKGYHGLRTWNSKIQYSDFRVFSILQDT